MIAYSTQFAVRDNGKHLRFDEAFRLDLVACEIMLPNDRDVGISVKSSNFIASGVLVPRFELEELRGALLARSASATGVYATEGLQQAPFVELQWADTMCRPQMLILTSARLLELHFAENSGGLGQVLTLTGEVMGSGLFRHEFSADSRGGVLVKFFGRSDKLQLHLTWGWGNAPGNDKTAKDASDTTSMSAEEAAGLPAVQNAIAEALARAEKNFGQALVVTNRRIDSLAESVALLHTAVAALQRTVRPAEPISGGLPGGSGAHA
jgi:hypothetical protein